MTKGWPRPGSKGIDKPSPSDTKPRPMPTTMTAGRNAEARNGENRPMKAPDQKIGNAKP